MASRRRSYDDMLDDYCADDAEACAAPPGLFKFGAWVNGGQWSTQEGRMLMAYWRTGRAQVKIFAHIKFTASGPAWLLCIL